MRYDSLVDSLVDFIATHPEIKKANNFVIYNEWALATDTIVKDVSVLQWILSFINDVKTISADVLDGASSISRRVP